MTGDDRQPSDDTEPSSGRGLTHHDRRRLAVTARVMAVAVLVAVLGAGAVGLLGASGAAGLASFLVLSSAGCMIGALVTAALAMLDEWRRAPVAGHRALVALGLGLLAAALLVMSLGAAAAA
ncbi:MAG: hypothetical protein ACLFRD_09365 [Nitriliruptoraceae bacterium]